MSQSIITPPRDALGTILALGILEKTEDMKSVARYIMLMMLCVPLRSVAQEPSGAEQPSIDSAVMSILERYTSHIPDYENTLRIRSWMTNTQMALMHAIGTPKHIWQELTEAPHTEIPTLDISTYNIFKVHIGHRSRVVLTISNGSAYNNMPWTDAPQGYLNAETLSFPIPR